MWNILGQLIPMLVGLASIPLLIRCLGNERFAILSLIWMVTGYFGLFDLGLGRALTQAVAEKLGAHRVHEIPPLVTSVVWLMLGMGALAGALFWGLTPYAVAHWMSIPGALKGEAQWAGLFVALAIPWIVSGTALRGVLEAAHRFDLVNILRMPLAAGLYLVPAVVAYFTRELTSVVFSILFLRIIGFFLHWWACQKIFPDLRFRSGYQHKIIKPLYTFGLWMTVSNIVSPIMVQMDRFYVGAVVSLSAVAYYSTAYELVSRAYALPMAITAVLFPAMTKAFAADVLRASVGSEKQNWAESKKTYLQSFKILALAVFPMMFLLGFFSYEIVWVWLGADYAKVCSPILQIFAFGVCFNAMANVPFNFLQAIGKPDLTAKIHLFELPIYILALKYLTETWGLPGAAWTWSLRVIGDLILMLIITQTKALPIPEFLNWSFWLKRVGGPLTIAALTFYLAQILTWPWKLAFTAASLPLFLIITYKYILSVSDRDLIKEKLFIKLQNKRRRS